MPRKKLPPKRVPKNHRWCNGCGGNGRNGGYQRRPCEVCRGKGVWNAEDIRQYHEKYPNLCKQSCGDTHRDPSFETHAQIMRRMKKIEKELRAIAKKLGVKVEI